MSRRAELGQFFTPEWVAQSLVLGNPPFQQRTIQRFLARAWDVLLAEGQVGFILPAFALQTAITVDQLATTWHMQQDMLPRNVFPGLIAPLCFVRLTKGARRELVRFALYHEAAASVRLQDRCRLLLAQGERSVWGAVTRAALEALGGAASLAEIYREVQGHRPTTNRYWQEKVRQVLQRIAYRIGPGRWAIREGYGVRYR